MDNCELKEYLLRVGTVRRKIILKKLKTKLEEHGLTKQQVYNGLVQLVLRPRVHLTRLKITKLPHLRSQVKKEFEQCEKSSSKEVIQENTSEVESKKLKTRNGKIDESNESEAAESRPCGAAHRPRIVEDVTCIEGTIFDKSSIKNISERLTESTLAKESKCNEKIAESNEKEEDADKNEEELENMKFDKSVVNNIFESLMATSLTKKSNVDEIIAKSKKEEIEKNNEKKVESISTVFDRSSVSNISERLTESSPKKKSISDETIVETKEKVDEDEKKARVIKKNDRSLAINISERLTVKLANESKSDETIAESNEEEKKEETDDDEGKDDEEEEEEEELVGITENALIDKDERRIILLRKISRLRKKFRQLFGETVTLSDFEEEDELMNSLIPKKRRKARKSRMSMDSGVWLNEMISENVENSVDVFNDKIVEEIEEFPVLQDQTQSLEFSEKIQNSVPCGRSMPRLNSLSPEKINNLLPQLEPEITANLAEETKLNCDNLAEKSKLNCAILAEKTELNCDNLAEETKLNCDNLAEETKLNCAILAEKTELNCDNLAEETKLNCDNLAEETKLNCAILAEKTELNCDNLAEETKLNCDNLAEETKLNCDNLAEETKLNCAILAVKTELNCHNLAEETKLNCDNLAEETKLNCAILAEKTELNCDNLAEETKLNCAILAEKTELNCDNLAEETKLNCDNLAEKSKSNCAILAEKTELNCDNLTEGTKLNCAILAEKTELNCDNLTEETKLNCDNLPKKPQINHDKAPKKPRVNVDKARKKPQGNVDNAVKISQVNFDNFGGILRILITPVEPNGADSFPPMTLEYDLRSGTHVSTTQLSYSKKNLRGTKNRNKDNDDSKKPLDINRKKKIRQKTQQQKTLNIAAENETLGSKNIPVSAEKDVAIKWLDPNIDSILAESFLSDSQTKCQIKTPRADDFTVNREDFNENSVLSRSATQFEKNGVIKKVISESEDVSVTNELSDISLVVVKNKLTGDKKQLDNVEKKKVGLKKSRIKVKKTKKNSNYKENLSNSLPKLRVLHHSELGSRWCPTPTNESLSSIRGMNKNREISSVNATIRNQPFIQATNSAEYSQYGNQLQDLQEINENRLKEDSNYSSSRTTNNAKNASFAYENLPSNNQSLLRRRLQNIEYFLQNHQTHYPQSITVFQGSTNHEQTLPSENTNFPTNTITNNNQTTQNVENIPQNQQTNLAQPTTNNPATSSTANQNVASNSQNNDGPYTFDQVFIRSVNHVLFIQNIIRLHELPSSVTQRPELQRQFLDRKKILFEEFKKYAELIGTEDTNMVVHDFLGRYEQLVEIDRRCFSFADMFIIWRLDDLDEINRAKRQMPFHSAVPSAVPSALPSAPPSARPSAPPSTRPSALPSALPSAPPSARPSTRPSAPPSALPSARPSAPTSTRPSAPPSTRPSAPPSTRPSAPPSTRPSAPPSTRPSAPPSARPSASPSATSSPSDPPKSMRKNAAPSRSAVPAVQLRECCCPDARCRPPTSSKVTKPGTSTSRTSTTESKKTRSRTPPKIAQAGASTSRTPPKIAQAGASTSRTETRNPQSGKTSSRLIHSTTSSFSKPTPGSLETSTTYISARPQLGNAHLRSSPTYISAVPQLPAADLHASQTYISALPQPGNGHLSESPTYISPAPQLPTADLLHASSSTYISAVPQPGTGNFLRSSSHISGGSQTITGNSRTLPTYIDPVPPTMKGNSRTLPPYIDPVPQTMPGNSRTLPTYIDPVPQTITGNSRTLPTYIDSVPQTITGNSGTLPTYIDPVPQTITGNSRTLPTYIDPVRHSGTGNFLLLLRYIDPVPHSGAGNSVTSSSHISAVSQSGTGNSLTSSSHISAVSQSGTGNSLTSSSHISAVSQSGTGNFLTSPSHISAVPQPGTGKFLTSPSRSSAVSQTIKEDSRTLPTYIDPVPQAITGNSRTLPTYIDPVPQAITGNSRTLPTYIDPVPHSGTGNSLTSSSHISAVPPAGTGNSLTSSSHISAVPPPGTGNSLTSSSHISAVPPARTGNSLTSSSHISAVPPAETGNSLTSSSHISAVPPPGTGNSLTSSSHISAVPPPGTGNSLTSSSHISAVPPARTGNSLTSSSHISAVPPPGTANSLTSSSHISAVPPARTGNSLTSSSHISAVPPAGTRNSLTSSSHISAIPPPGTGNSLTSSSHISAVPPPGTGNSLTSSSHISAVPPPGTANSLTSSSHISAVPQPGTGNSLTSSSNISAVSQSGTRNFLTSPSQISAVSQPGTDNCHTSSSQTSAVSRTESPNRQLPPNNVSGIAQQQFLKRRPPPAAVPIRRCKKSSIDRPYKYCYPPETLEILNKQIKKYNESISDMYEDWHTENMRLPLYRHVYDLAVLNIVGRNRIESRRRYNKLTALDEQQDRMQREMLLARQEIFQGYLSLWQRDVLSRHLSALLEPPSKPITDGNSTSAPSKKKKSKSVTARTKNSISVTATTNTSTSVTAKTDNSTSVIASTNSSGSVTATTNNSTSVIAATNSSGSVTPTTNNSTSVIATTNSSTSVTATTNNSTSVIPPTNNSTSVTPPTNNSTSVTPPTNNSTSVTATTNNSTSVIATTNSSRSVTSPTNDSTSVTPPTNNSTSVTPKTNSSTCVTPPMNTSTSTTPTTNNSTIAPSTMNNSTFVSSTTDTSTSVTATTNNSTSVTPPTNNSTSVIATTNNSTSVIVTTNSSTSVIAKTNNSTSVTPTTNSSTSETPTTNNSTSVTSTTNNSTFVPSTTNNSTIDLSTTNNSTIDLSTTNNSTIDLSTTNNSTHVSSTSSNSRAQQNSTCATDLNQRNVTQISANCGNQSGISITGGPMKLSQENRCNSPYSVDNIINQKKFVRVYTSEDHLTTNDSNSNHNSHIPVQRNNVTTVSQNSLDNSLGNSRNVDVPIKNIPKKRISEFWRRFIDQKNEENASENLGDSTNQTNEISTDQNKQQYPGNLTQTICENHMPTGKPVNDEKNEKNVSDELEDCRNQRNEISMNENEGLSPGTSTQTICEHQMPILSPVNSQKNEENASVKLEGCRNQRNEISMNENERLSPVNSTQMICEHQMPILSPVNGQKNEENASVKLEGCRNQRNEISMNENELLSTGNSTQMICEHQMPILSPVNGQKNEENASVKLEGCRNQRNEISMNENELLSPGNSTQMICKHQMPILSPVNGQKNEENASVKLEGCRNQRNEISMNENERLSPGNSTQMICEHQMPILSPVNGQKNEENASVKLEGCRNQRNEISMNENERLSPGNSTQMICEHQMPILSPVNGQKNEENASVKLEGCRNQRNEISMNENERLSPGNSTETICKHEMPISKPVNGQKNEENASVKLEGCRNQRNEISMNESERLSPRTSTETICKHEMPISKPVNGQRNGISMNQNKRRYPETLKQEIVTQQPTSNCEISRENSENEEPERENSENEEPERKKRKLESSGTAKINSHAAVCSNDKKYILVSVFNNRCKRLQNSDLNKKLVEKNNKASPRDYSTIIAEKIAIKRRGSVSTPRFNLTVERHELPKNNSLLSCSDYPKTDENGTVNLSKERSELRQNPDAQNQEANKIKTVLIRNDSSTIVNKRNEDSTEILTKERAELRQISAVAFDDKNSRNCSEPMANIPSNTCKVKVVDVLEELHSLPLKKKKNKRKNSPKKKSARNLFSPHVTTIVPMEMIEKSANSVNPVSEDDENDVTLYQSDGDFAFATESEASVITANDDDDFGMLWIDESETAEVVNEVEIRNEEITLVENDEAAAAEKELNEICDMTLRENDETAEREANKNREINLNENSERAQGEIHESEVNSPQNREEILREINDTNADKNWPKNSDTTEKIQDDPLGILSILDVKTIPKDVFYNMEGRDNFQPQISPKIQVDKADNLDIRDVPLPKCSRCGKSSILVCEQCYKAFYCSNVCHHAHWMEIHHLTCKPVPEEAIESMQ